MVAVLPCVEQSTLLFESSAESPRRRSRTAVRIATEGPVPPVERIVDRDLERGLMRNRMRMRGRATRCESCNTCAYGEKTTKHPARYTPGEAVLSRFLSLRRSASR